MKRVKRFLIKYIAINIYRIYWKTVNPFSVGVRVIVKNKDNKILLVKHSYKNKWYLPGGGMKKFEKSLDCAKREIKEEVNLDITDIEFQGIYRGIEEHHNDWLLIFRSKVVDASKIEIDKIEIDDYLWADSNDLKELEIDNRSYLGIRDQEKNISKYFLDI